jgi:pimeloyl-ACP methyl ester carboxylesterase
VNTSNGAWSFRHEERRVAKQVTVLFVHGWQGDRSVWDDVIAELGDRARAIAVDLPGSGASSRVAGPYDLERFAGELHRFVGTLGDASVVVVGHSMGAKVALRLAVDAPHAVRALILIAPVPAGPAGFSGAGQDYLRATAGDAAQLRAWLAKTVESPPDDATLDRLTAIASQSPPNAVLESLESWMRADLAEAARAIRVPTLVIAPEQDQPGKAKTRVADLIPGAHYAVLPGAAHYCIVEKPAGVAKMIREFIESESL